MSEIVHYNPRVIKFGGYCAAQLYGKSRRQGVQLTAYITRQRGQIIQLRVYTGETWAPILYVSGDTHFQGVRTDFDVHWRMENKDLLPSFAIRDDYADSFCRLAIEGPSGRMGFSVVMHGDGSEIFKVFTGRNEDRTVIGTLEGGAWNPARE